MVLEYLRRDMRTQKLFLLRIAIVAAAICMLALVEAQPNFSTGTANWRKDWRGFGGRKHNHLHGIAAIRALDKNDTVARKIARNHRLTIPVVKSTLQADTDLAVDPQGKTHEIITRQQGARAAASCHTSVSIGLGLSSSESYHVSIPLTPA
jgi:hypothetical protein